MKRYLRVANQLQERIDGNEWAVGERLPGQRELARFYGCSERSILEAESVLAARGRLQLKPREGAFVLDPNLPRLHLDLGMVVSRNEYGYLFNQHAGHWPPLTPPTREVIACPDDVAQLLQVDPGSDVLARRRVVGPGPDEPLQITTTYLPWPLAEGTVLAEEDTGPGGYLDRLEHDMKRGPLDWPAQVQTRLPTPDEAADLVMPTQLPVLVEMRIATSPDEQPLAVDVVIRDGRRWSLGYRLHRDESAQWPTMPARDRNVPEQPKSA